MLDFVLMENILFLGTGDSGSSRNCSSYLLNERILFDVGHGTVGALRQNGFDVEDISTIIISHFHIDHIGDLLFFLYRKATRECTTPLTIVGSPGLENYLAKQYTLQTSVSATKLVEMDFLKPSIDFVNIIELDYGQTINVDGTSLRAFEVDHGEDAQPTNTNGYITKLGNLKVGFSGDTKMCDKILSEIPNADTWLIDCSTGREKAKRHLNLTQVEEIATKYQDKRFYCVHRKDWDDKPVEPNVFLPNDGDKILLEP